MHEYAVTALAQRLPRVAAHHSTPLQPAAIADADLILTAERRHRGIVVSDPIGALAHLQLGRALAMTGDKAGAKKEYEEFLKIWKEADAGLPVLVRARGEYAEI